MFAIAHIAKQQSTAAPATATATATDTAPVTTISVTSENKDATGANDDATSVVDTSDLSMRIPIQPPIIKCGLTVQLLDIIVGNHNHFVSPISSFIFISPHVTPMLM
jgi:hypothetical protein